MGETGIIEAAASGKVLAKKAWQPERERMRKKKPKFTPVTMPCEPTLELKPIPVAANCAPKLELKFMPPVTLSYEATLELKPIPVTVSTEHAGEAGEGAVRRMTKAARTARAKKAAASAKVPSPRAKKLKARK